MRFRVHHPLSVSFFIASRAIHGARPGIADPFKAATSLLSYWRDEAAHGTVSEISEIEPPLYGLRNLLATIGPTLQVVRCVPARA
jgi:hypothetical protein